MKLSRRHRPSALAALILAAAAPLADAKRQDIAVAASAASAPARACASRAAASSAPATRTSKLRHVPDEGDPCASSSGLAPKTSR